MKEDNVQISSNTLLQISAGSGDCSSLYALSLLDGETKGLLLDPFDLFQDDADHPVQARLRGAERAPSYNQSQAGQRDLRGVIFP